MSERASAPSLSRQGYHHRAEREEDFDENAEDGTDDDSDDGDDFS